jgi:hypothetical protein
LRGFLELGLKEIVVLGASQALVFGAVDVICDFLLTIYYFD